MSELTIAVNGPTGSRPDDRDDMWVWDEEAGYIVACGYTAFPPTCPVWGDEVGWKSVTVIVPAELENAATWSLEYNHGGGSVVKRLEMGDGRVALRSDYQCW